MSDKYTTAAEDVRRFFGRVSAETDATNGKINEYADRLGEITKQGNPAEWDAIMKESAADLEAYAQRVDGLLPDYRRNLELLTEGFDKTVKLLDPATDAGAQELEGMRRESQALAEVARGVKAKITTLRGILVVIRDANYDPRLTQAARTLITTTGSLLAAYDDFETFGLKISFSADQK